MAADSSLEFWGENDHLFDNGSVDKLFLNKTLGVRIAAGAASSLSILGSLLIIFTFCIFPHLRRTRTRQILLHISIMDLGVAVANLIGTIVYFDHYYYSYNNSSNILTFKEDVSMSVNISCKAQAFVALYSTHGSIFWTNWLAVYLYFSVVHHYNAKISKGVLIFGYLLCYLMPLGLSSWLLATDRLGFSPYGSVGWCSIQIQLTKGTTYTKAAKDTFATMFGYDLWIYLTFVLVPVLFIGIRSHISIELSKNKNLTSKEKLWAAVHNVDFKFILIPITFIFLRIWTCIMMIVLVYSTSMNSIHTQNVVRVLICLAAMGDSGQGVANALIFVFFTKKVREELLCCMYCRRKRLMRESLSRPPWEKSPLLNT